MYMHIVFVYVTPLCFPTLIAIRYTKYTIQCSTNPYLACRIPIRYSTSVLIPEYRFDARHY